MTVSSADLQGGGQTLWDVYKLFNLQGSTDWYAAARQLPKLIALFFVVTFGSSLDISAIQADLPIPLDYNRELQTVGAQQKPALPEVHSRPQLMILYVNARLIAAGGPVENPWHILQI